MNEVLGVKRQTMPVMVEFMFQPDWDEGCQAVGKMLFWGVCVRVSLEETDV